MKKDKVDLYQKLHELTLPVCASCTHLGKPFACCEEAACEQAAVDALKEGVFLIPPFISDNGCLLPPHLRPQCTKYTCAVSWKNEQTEWREEYEKLIKGLE